MIYWSVENTSWNAIIYDNGLLYPTNIGNIEEIATSLDGSNVQGSKTITIVESTTDINLYEFGNYTYPNPFKNVINFQLVKNFNSIKITTIDGKIVYEGPYIEKINTSSYKRVIYIVSIFDKNGLSNNLMMIKNL